MDAKCVGTCMVCLPDCPVHQAEAMRRGIVIPKEAEEPDSDPDPDEA